MAANKGRGNKDRLGVQALAEEVEKKFQASPTLKKDSDSKITEEPVVDVHAKHASMIMPVIQELEKNEKTFREGLGAFNSVSDEILEIIQRSKKLSGDQKQKAESLVKVAKIIHEVNEGLEEKYKLLQAALAEEDYVNAQSHLQDILNITEQNKKYFATYSILFDECSSFISSQEFSKNKESKLFEKITRKLETLNRPEGSGISAFIILPVQRVTRYPMTMEQAERQIVKYKEKTGQEHPFSAEISAAHQSLKEFAADINQAKDVAEKQRLRERIREYEAQKSKKPLKSRADFNIKALSSDLVDKDKVFSAIQSVEKINGYKITVEKNPKNENELFIRNANGNRIAHITYNGKDASSVTCKVRRKHMDYDALEAMTGLMQQALPGKEPAITRECSDSKVKALFDIIRELPFNVGIVGGVKQEGKVDVSVQKADTDIKKFVQSEQNYIDGLNALVENKDKIETYLIESKSKDITLSQKYAITSLIIVAKDIAAVQDDMKQAFDELDWAISNQDYIQIARQLDTIGRLREKSELLHSNYARKYQNEFKADDKLWSEINKANLLGADISLQEVLQQSNTHFDVYVDVINKTNAETADDSVVKPLMEKLAKAFLISKENITPSKRPKSLTILKDSAQQNDLLQASKEMRDTEEAYLKNLKILTSKEKDIISIIDKDTRSGASDEQKQALKELVQLAKIIQGANKSMETAFSDLHQAYSDNNQVGIAKALDKISNLTAQSEKLHSDYNKIFAVKLNIYDSNVNKLMQKLNPIFTKIPEAGGKGADSFLMEPVQRFPRYLLLTKELAKHTDKSSPSAHLLAKVVKNFEESNTRINESLPHRGPPKKKK